MYTDITIDFETLGLNTATAPILSIGAVAFNLEDEDNLDTLSDQTRLFYSVLDVKDQIERYDRVIEYDTMTWWMQQGAVARDAVFNNDHSRASVTSALLTLNTFIHVCTDSKAPRVWGNGSIFDVAILENLYSDADYEAIYPFKYRDVMDLRTLRLAAGSPNLDIERGVAHNALDDAVYQTLCAQGYMRIINQR